MNKKIYESRSIETKPLEREILVHGAMLYQCEYCGKVFQMWLEKGLEDKKQDEINPNSHKPVPFCIDCLCGGMAKHIAWGSDIHLHEYRPLKENENYFENSPDSDCGISHIRNNIDFRIDEIEKRKLTEQEELRKLFETEKAESAAGAFKNDYDEEDPYGLAQISTSMLKAELRRRKRWK